MIDVRDGSGEAGLILGKRTVLQLSCGVFVALIGLFLAIGSDNPVWLSAAQVGAGATMTVSAWRAAHRSPNRRSPSRCNQPDCDQPGCDQPGCVAGRRRPFAASPRIMRSAGRRGA
ncbi:hypothetical protein [Prauserella alba]|uniref:Uncharacterized protein n=1 Tax=Prauserella alba TaxID=176898 RepID=A0ABN1VBP8_9PSEU|nr:hypothetical protein [Prauserella alba]MCP2179121.1 hypothetical protein [Prauserella alba]